MLLNCNFLNGRDSEKQFSYHFLHTIAHYIFIYQFLMSSFSLPNRFELCLHFCPYSCHAYIYTHRKCIISKGSINQNENCWKTLCSKKLSNTFLPCLFKYPCYLLSNVSFYFDLLKNLIKSIIGLLTKYPPPMNKYHLTPLLSHFYVTSTCTCLVLVIR